MLLVLGCAKATPRAAVRASPAAATRESDIITEAELLDPSVIGGNAFEAVRRLRPRFLASRGASSIRSADAGTVHASLDGGALQSLDLLSRMRPAEIAEIRYLSASQAAQQFGTSSGAGAVLLIKTK